MLIPLLVLSHTIVTYSLAIPMSQPFYLFTGKSAFNWIPDHHKAFDAIKALLLKGVLHWYPSDYLLFHI